MPMRISGNAAPQDSTVTATAKIAVRLARARRAAVESDGHGVSLIAKSQQLT